MTCNTVVGIFNDTEGKPVDVIRAAETKRFIRDGLTKNTVGPYADHTPAVQSMTNVLTNDLSSGQSPKVVAHSEGGAITALALIHTRSNLSMIGRQANLANTNVTSMGSVAQSWPDGPQYTHYINTDDVFANNVGIGDAQEAREREAIIVRYSGKEGAFIADGTGVKRAYLPLSISAHLADSNYLPYIKSNMGVCMAAKP